MIGLSTAVKDAMLSIFTNQPLTVGLFDGESEIVDPRYERLPIEFGEPEDDAGVRFIANTNDSSRPIDSSTRCSAGARAGSRSA